MRAAYCPKLLPRLSFSNIFHLNLLQIIIVLCPNAQTLINFLIKQLGLGILYLLVLLSSSSSSSYCYCWYYIWWTNQPSLALFTLHRSFLVIKSYLFRILLLLVQVINVVWVQYGYDGCSVISATVPTRDCVHKNKIDDIDNRETLHCYFS